MKRSKRKDLKFLEQSIATGAWKEAAWRTTNRQHFSHRFLSLSTEKRKWETHQGFYSSAHKNTNKEPGVQNSKICSFQETKTSSLLSTSSNRHATKRAKTHRSLSPLLETTSLGQIWSRNAHQPFFLRFPQRQARIFKTNPSKRLQPRTRKPQQKLKTEKSFQVKANLEREKKKEKKRECRDNKHPNSNRQEREKGGVSLFQGLEVRLKCAGS